MARSGHAPDDSPISIDPRVVDLWFTAMQLPTALRSVTVVTGAGAPARRDAGETHTVPTLIACLRGVVRIECAGRNLDLTAGEAALIAPGAWHRHAALKAGSACLGQGFMLGGAARRRGGVGGGGWAGWGRAPPAARPGAPSC